MKNEKGKVKLNPKIVGENIRKLRQAKNMTQRQLAAELNVTNKAISRWECGYGLPDITLLPEVAKTFDVTIEELTGDKEILPVHTDTVNEGGGDAESVPARKKTPFGRKKIIAIAAACLSVLLVAGAAALIISSVNGANPDLRTAYRFEAEESVYRGSVYTEADIYASNTYCAANMVRNMLSFTIYSDREEKGVPLSVRMSSCIEMYNERGTLVGMLGVNIEDFDVINVNNAIVPLTGKVNGSGTGDKSHYLSFYNWSVVTGTVDLSEGKNEIRIVTGNVAFNFDYIELSTEKAELSWTPTPHV